MKKLVVSLLMFAFVASCATTRPQVKHKYSHLTPERIQTTCEADNHWRMTVSGVTVIVVQFEHCLGVNDMLVMVTTTEQYTKEIRSYSLKLLELHYLEFLKNTKTDKTWTLEKIREYTVSKKDSGQDAEWFVVYKVNSKPKAKKCSGPTCKKKK